MACLGSHGQDQNQDSVSGLSPKHPSPSSLSWAAPPTGWGRAYPVTREVRKPSTGSRTSWLIRGRMSMRVVSDRYTMIFWVRVTAASSPASLRLFSRLGLEVLPGAT